MRRDVLSDEYSLRLSGEIRSGLADGVRGLDAVGRVVRGDGSLVLNGGEGEEDDVVLGLVLGTEGWVEGESFWWGQRAGLDA